MRTAYPQNIVRAGFKPAPTGLKCLLFIAIFAFPTYAAEDPCAKARAAWSKVNAYSCTYRAVTTHEGKMKESLMTYIFQKPDKVRMDIKKPRNGAVLIYNPEVSEEVRIRPFTSFKSMVMKYPLTHKRVSSGEGGTIDKSDLGHRIEAVCAEFPSKSKKVLFYPNGLLKKLEELNGEGKVTQTFEWTDLKIDPEIPSTTFTDF